jgi:Alpha/beta hydrolase
VDDVAAWWVALPALVQRALIGTRPEVVGALDGVPAWARDRANRLLLHRALGDDRLSAYQAFTARAVNRQLAALDRTGQPVQLHTFDLAGDRVAVALGDVDTADAVAVLVPGILNTPADDLGRLTRSGRAVAGAARQAEPARKVAALVWLGYRTPDDPLAMATRFAARRGGVALAGDLDGLAAARVAAGRPPARTTVVAHSYGTVVVDEAADVAGRLAADAVVLLGSPGMEDDAAALEAPEVYVGAAPADLVSWLGWFGRPPSEEGFGAAALPAEATTGHSDWFDADRPTLAAMGRVVAGDGPGK